MAMAAPIPMPTDPALTLHSWLSPAFPTGAFSWSHGLETLIAEGTITNADGLEQWLAGLLRYGSARSDAILLARTMEGEDVADLAAALAPSRERYTETMEQGAAFARTINATQPFTISEAAYPVAVGRAAMAAGMAPAMVLPLYLQAVIANLIHAGIRLIPLGQTDGQRILTALQPLCSDIAAEAETAPLDEIGTAMVLTDIASARHEALYSRIFRS